MMRKSTFSKVFIGLLPLLLLCRGLALAQEPTPQPPTPDPKIQANPAQSDNPSGDSASVDNPVVVTTTMPEVRQISGAGFLTPSISPLRWGPLYVGYAQFAQILSEGNSFTGQGSFQNTASQFAADIVLDKQFRRAHVALQYVPRMMILDGNVYGNFANQDTGANIVFAITPRFTLDLGDRFVYYRSSNSFADIFLSSDPVSGTTLQRDFIESPASWLSNSASASFAYAISARTHITVTPTYIYDRTSGQATATTIPNVQEYGVNVSVSHDLTARSSVNALYTEQTDVFPGISHKTVYQTLLGGYSHSWTGGWNFSGSLGFTTASLQSGRIWSEAGSLSVSKAFRRSRVAVAYYRGHSFAGYISQDFSDRVDMTYQQYVGRRWTLGGGVGYFRNVVTGNGVWAKYGEANLSFGLTSTLSLFGSYVYKWQRSENLSVYSGDTNYLRCGIQWTPHRLAR
jgi:hypothetical protein